MNLDVIIVDTIKYMDVKFFISKVLDINQFEIIIILGDFFGFKFFDILHKLKISCNTKLIRLK